MGRAAILLVLIAGGCTHAGPPPQTYAQELAALDAACRTGGGRLIPVSNTVSARAADDYACMVDQAPG